ncbi:MAG: hypothetical protein JXR47_01250 [Thiotrichales bacterium]|nr:hypothetical protein [Thiotrichales bacterium]
MTITSLEAIKTTGSFQKAFSEKTVKFELLNKNESTAFDCTKHSKKNKVINGVLGKLQFFSIKFLRKTGV